jgi:hypothetical protein
MGFQVWDGGENFKGGDSEVLLYKLTG